MKLRSLKKLMTPIVKNVFVSLSDPKILSRDSYDIKSSIELETVFSTIAAIEMEKKILTSFFFSSKN